MATGIDGRRTIAEQVSENRVAPTVAPKTGKRCKSLATGDNWAKDTDCTKGRFRSSKQAVSAS